jgi:hypothetical protein
MAQFARMRARDERSYHAVMVAKAPWFRVAGFVLIAAGAARAIIGNLNGEGINDAGLAPSALQGEILIALGSFALWSSYLARTGRSWWLVVPAGLALLVVGGVGTMLVDQAHPSEYAHGLREPVGYVVAAGFSVCYVAVVLTLTYAMLAAGAYMLSWLLDLLPPLRRRGLGASIRRKWRLPLGDPA